MTSAEKEFQIRLDKIERLVVEMHARVMTGGYAPL